MNDRADTAVPHAPDPSDSMGELVARMSHDVTQLVRGELELARVELTDKAKRAGTGVGMFGAGGLIALYGIGAVVTAAILGLTEALPAWLAALIVGAVLLAAAAVIALLGRRNVRSATPATPEKAVEGVKQDVAAVRRGAGR